MRFVQCLFSAGLPSRAIRDILPFLDTGVATPPMRERLADEYDRNQHGTDELSMVSAFAPVLATNGGGAIVNGASGASWMAPLRWG